MKNNIKIIVTRRLPIPIEERLNEMFTCVFNKHDVPFDEEKLIWAVENADVLIPTITDNLTAKILENSKNLKLIANFGAGVDHIDLPTAEKKNITITNTPDVLAEDSADLAIALILSASRRIGEGARLIRSGAWEGWTPTFHLGKRVWGKKLGIIGMGTIGLAVAKRAKAFNMEIHYHNRNPVSKDLENQLNATYWESLDQMIANMDIISIHCPYTPSTYHLINKRRIELMKKSAVLINTARGEIIDENELVNALQNQKIFAAGLDVYDNEPDINPRLSKVKNIILTPHIASATVESRTQMGEIVIINIQSFIDGHRPPNRILEEFL